MGGGSVVFPEDLVRLEGRVDLWFACVCVWGLMAVGGCG